MAKFERREDIDVPIPRVWNVLTDLGMWREWFPDMDAIQGGGTLQKGVTFQFQDNGQTGTATVTRADVNHMLEVVTDLNGNKTNHRFMLSPKGGLFGLFGGNATWLEYEMEYDAGAGPIGEFIKSGNPMDLRKVKDTLAKIENVAERPDAPGSGSIGTKLPPGS